MPVWVLDGLTLAEVITIIGGIGALVFAAHGIRRAVRIGDAVVNLVGALEHEFTPNGGRHVISADDDSATTKDVLLDIRQSFKEIVSNQTKHEKEAERRTQKLLDALIELRRT